jgi:hypothetical protein
MAPSWVLAPGDVSGESLTEIDDALQRFHRRAALAGQYQIPLDPNRCSASNSHMGTSEYPADDVYAWIEQESSIMLKAVTAFGDPVELSADEARSIAAALLDLAARLDGLNGI